jgi:hypothetical protein
MISTPSLLRSISANGNKAGYVIAKREIFKVMRYFFFKYDDVDVSVDGGEHQFQQ